MNQNIQHNCNDAFYEYINHFHYHIRDNHIDAFYEYKFQHLHIQHKNIQEKSKSIARASRIVLGLQGALDFEKGGDLANNLNELYGYVTRRLLHVNARNDLDALEEIFGLMNEIRSAWEGVPDLIPASPRAGALLNWYNRQAIGPNGGNIS